MNPLEPKQLVENKYLGLWSLLAFQAGFINSIGFLACRRYVSHVTGFGTQLGIMLGDQKYLGALESVEIPLSFVLGAWLCGHLTVARKARGLIPRYDLLVLLMPILLFFALILGASGVLGEFGEPALFEEDFLFLSILSFTCGVQNATFATLTQGQIRTTHLTGISTDFGTDLALLSSGNLPPPEYLQIKRKNILRVITWMSFTVGAFLSSLIDDHLEYWSLLIPGFTSLLVAAIFFAFKRETVTQEQGEKGFSLLGRN